MSNVSSPQNATSPAPPTIGILAFDAAKAMCRLLSLYKSLADDEIFKLKHETIKSRGVTYLNSKDETFLLSLACAERLEQLDLVAGAVSRFGLKCSDGALKRFSLVYTDLKFGMIDMRKFEFDSQRAEKIIDKMEKLITSTSNLYQSIVYLTEFQVSNTKSNLSYQRIQVQYCKDVSLWNQTYDATVGIMARIVCVVYARIIAVFASGSICLSANPKRCSNLLPSLCSKCCVVQRRDSSLVDKGKVKQRALLTGSISKTSTSKTGRTRFSPRLSSRLVVKDIQSSTGDENRGRRRAREAGKNDRVFRLAPPSTVGGAGLSLRYANMVIFAERCLYNPATIDDEARGVLYEMLPAKLKERIKAKMRRQRYQPQEKEREHALAVLKYQRGLN